MNLLAALVDDAGLFPPESLPMTEALARHRADEAAGYPMLSHRFLCPASRIGELRTEWARLADDGGEGRLRLGVILDTGADGLDAAQAEVAADPLLVLEMVEVPAPSPEAVAAALAALADFEPAAFLEGPRSPDWVKAVAAANQPGRLRGAKVRCGGARADLFPSPDELAAFICACFEHGVPFKATAGLHGAVRHRDEETGFVHHGFLNLVLAAVAAAMGASVRDVAVVLAATDGPTLAAEARAVPGRELSAARLLFRAYGSCSTSEPREEAAALGLLGA
ncbi:MAG TPA: hypothetical protein VG034_20670 [Acidimicrobiia bacterium]|jgi:hypothetical protein|nr:hypothetical protein [Acidimicrobiia bacterium]